MSRCPHGGGSIRRDSAFSDPIGAGESGAGRREFWVALDAQRRGRGVQVFTFRCMNLAGYGPDDPDERSRAVLTDMEVDGMLGVMNLVDAVRSRIPGSITGSFTRLNAQSNANGQDAPRMQSVDRSNRQLDADARAAQVTGQLTSSMSVLMTPNTAGSPPSLSSPGSPDAGVSPRTGMPMPT